MDQEAERSSESKEKTTTKQEAKEVVESINEESKTSEIHKNKVRWQLMDR